MGKADKPRKKVLTPFERLERRIKKEFVKKKLIGDIIIKENEYELLVAYFKSKCEVLFKSYTYRIKDPVFATAVVQIGIRYYDGKLWPHVASILGLKSFNQKHRESIGTSFIATLSSYNKVLTNKQEYVKNILMHGFVSNYYAYEMFDFLFKYYNLDLERDIRRNNKEMMDGLIETIQKSDNTNRTYLLVKQTADAIGINSRGGKIRIRWLLRLIDKCFWEQITPSNPVSRISILFNKWQEISEEFKFQYNKYNSCTLEKGKKSFSSPYLKSDYRNNRFELVLPTQLIKFEYDSDIKWIISVNECKNVLRTSIYQAVTGYKTVPVEINIANIEIFNEIECGLYCGDNRIRVFKINSDCIRFFDIDGDSLNPNTGLPKGEVYAFTRADEIPKSEALIEIEVIGNLLRSFFEFEYGDIVRLPDGKPISIGKKIDEGLLYRKSVAGCYTLKDENQIPIYSFPPSIMLKIRESSSIGTLIVINGNRYRLFDSETTIVDLKDRKDEKGYITNLGDLGCKAEGTYTVYIDVPNDRTTRLWTFALINGFGYEFEESPYVFRSKGTIKFNGDISVESQDLYIEEKNSDENSYNFKIVPEVDDLHFVYKTSKESIDLYFEIPTFKWSFDSKEWNVDKPSDIWHSKFPSKVYIKYPTDRLTLSIDEELEISDNQGNNVICNKSKTKGNFECNTIRFKSWFGREKAKRIIYIDFIKNRTEFIGVITKSTIVSQILKGDFQSKRLIGEFEIVGYANYYADIILLESNKTIREKVPIIDGMFEFFDELESGLYKVAIFEDEEDETGFGIYNYLPLGEFEHDIINPYNLNGKNIALKHFKKSAKGAGEYFFSCRYVICNLKKIEEMQNSVYVGMLMIKTFSDNSPICYKVRVEFISINELRQIYLTFFDGYDYLEFLYDYIRRIIVKDEEIGLSRAIKYRRYEPLYSGDYYYTIEFTNDIPNNYILPSDYSLPEIAAAKDSNEKTPLEEECYGDILLSEIGISKLILNCLKKANIITIRDAIDRGINKFGHIRGLNKKMHKELTDRLYSFGVKIR